MQSWERNLGLAMILGFVLSGILWGLAVALDGFSSKLLEPFLILGVAATMAMFGVHTPAPLGPLVPIAVNGMVYAIVIFALLWASTWIRLRSKGTTSELVAKQSGGKPPHSIKP